MKLNVLLMSLCLATVAQAQLAPPPLEEMKKLEFLHGQWEGNGKMSMGPNVQHDATIVETVEPKLGGAVLLVEGLGHAGDKVVHNAIAIISYDRPSNSFKMRAYRMDGFFIDPKIEVGEKGFIWSFDLPQGSVRYTMTINEKGQWHEIGEMSRDEGKTWQQFFEMTLDRKTARN